MNRRSERGFTLIELLMVIIIIAVMSATMVPAYARFWSKTRFNGTVAQVRDCFVNARQQAILNDTSATVSFDARSQTFVVTVAPPPTQFDQPVAFGNTDTDNGGTVTPPTPTGVQLNPDIVVTSFQAGGNLSGGSGQPAGATEVHFRNDGTCDGADLQLASDSGYTAHLIVWPATGRVTLEDQP